MKILHIDIETAPDLIYAFGVYEVNAMDVARDWYMLGFGYQWNHLKQIHWVGQPDFPSFKRNRSDDKDVAKAAWKLLDEADIVLAHNGKQFDIKKLNTRFLIHGLPPPSPYQVLDTKLIARRYFGFSSNKLDQLSRQLDGERKLAHTGKDLWLGCMAGNLADWALMEKYCKHDVALLKKKYDRFLPWIENHPDWNIYEGTKDACPNCGRHLLKENGHRYSQKRRYQQFRCTGCGAYARGKYEPLT